ncbi:MAG TPA: cell division protein FtsA, partial [Candidatus Bathyarchaeia archaeon]|nr:cell division protein FtsA [Candidatus Bathyarchaeia archaeon]
ERIQNPVGMHGIRLEVQAHVITGSVTAAQNLVTCCERAGVEVTDIILEPLASAMAVLSQDEQQFGVSVIDIGGGTTDVAIYQQGAIRFTKVIPIAGNHFTNDLAIGLRITCSDAERIKKEYGGVRCWREKETLIEGEMVQGKDCQLFAREDIVNIIRPRAQELCMLVKQEFDDNKLYSLMTTGIVLTGGGSLLQGMRELAEDIFSVSVRIGYPRVVFDLPLSLQHPMYATGYGMLMYMMQKRDHAPHLYNGKIVRTLFDRMKMWVTDFF